MDGGDAPLPFLRMTQAQRAMSGAGSPSAMSETSGGGGSAQHTPAGAHARPPCSPFAPAPRWSPRGDDAAAAAAAVPPLSALKRSRSEASDFTGDSAALVPPPRPLTNKRYLSEVMSQNLARLKMALADGGAAEQAAAHAAAGFAHGGGGAHLAHPDVADGLAPPEQLAVARAAWAAGHDAAALAQQRAPAAHAARSDAAAAASELLLRRSSTAQLQPIQIGPPHGSRSAAVAAAESRLPPSPSDAAAATDLRRAALLRALQRRTGSGSFLGTAAMSRSVDDSDVSMASMSTGDEGDDHETEVVPMPAEAREQAAAPHAQPHAAQPQSQLSDGAVAWDDAPMSPPMGAANAAQQAAQAQPLPPELRLGPHWQLRG